MTATPVVVPAERDAEAEVTSRVRRFSNTRRRCQVHSIATVFPEMSAKEFADLVGDVSTNGLREAIWLYEGQILDGRHRYKACQQPVSNARLSNIPAPILSASY